MLCSSVSTSHVVKTCCFACFAWCVCVYFSWCFHCQKRTRGDSERERERDRQRERERERQRKRRKRKCDPSPFFACTSLVKALDYYCIVDCVVAGTGVLLDRIENMGLLMCHRGGDPNHPHHLQFGRFIQERKRHINLKIPGTPAGCPWDTRPDKQGSTGWCSRGSCCLLLKTDRDWHFCRDAGRVPQEHPTVQKPIRKFM